MSALRACTYLSSNGRSLYVALTNRSNSARLIETRGPSFKMPSFTGALPDVWEPTSEEAIREAMEALRCPTGAITPTELVFAGYGEPTLKLEVLTDVAAAASRQLEDTRAPAVRLNTNGLGELAHGRPIVPDLASAGVRSVTVALNTADEDQYMELMRPDYGAASHAAVLRFVRDCTAQGLEVECTCVEHPSVDVEATRALAADLGATLRTRSWHA